MNVIIVFFDICFKKNQEIQNVFLKKSNLPFLPDTDWQLHLRISHEHHLFDVVNHPTWLDTPKAWLIELESSDPVFAERDLPKILANDSSWKMLKDETVFWEKFARQ